jgi:nicotinate phosphoribosyltransferase
VGTKLVTAFDQPALGGVYKLGAIRDEQGRWQYRIKLSEQTVKVSNPGILQVRRYHDASENRGDMIFDQGSKPNPADGATMIDPADPNRRRDFAPDAPSTDLLVPIFRQGQSVYQQPSLDVIRQRVRDELDCTPISVKRFDNPHIYPVGLEESLHRFKASMIQSARQR